MKLNKERKNSIARPIHYKLKSNKRRGVEQEKIEIQQVNKQIQEELTKKHALDSEIQTKRINLK